jgi:hypothetical protein
MSFSSLNLSGGYLYANAISAYNFGTNDFTVEAWVKTMASGTIVGKKSTDGGNGNGGFLLVARPDGTIKFATDNGFGFYELNSVATSVCDGIWHHVAAVRQGTTISLYFDGQPISGTPHGNASPPLDVSNGYRLTIGTVDQQQEPYRNLTGAVSEVRLWNRARNASEIAAGYSTRLPPSAANLVGYWSVEQGLLAEFSGQNNAAQVSGKVDASTDAPAVGAGNAPSMLFLFSGVYDCAVKWGGTSGTWNPTTQLYLTSMGFVVQNNQVMNDVVISGNAIIWPLQGNPNSGNITFAPDNSNPYYWSTGQTRFNFTGSSQSIGSGAVDYRGVLMPDRLGCGVFLSIGAGQIFHTVNPVAGSPVTLAPKTGQVSEHYCVYDNNQILNMATGLALTAQGGLNAGASIVLAATDPAAANQQWILGNNGTITAVGAPNLAIAVDTSTRTPSPYQLKLATLNASDQNQQFITLSAPQFIFNANVAQVISGSASNQLTVQTKADDAPYELWCVSQNSYLSGATAQALAVSGTAAPGASITLAKYDPADTAQGFEFKLGQLIHKASGLPVKMSAIGSGLTLGASSEKGANLSWAIAATPPTFGGGRSTVATRSFAAQDAPATVDYIVEVYTSNNWLAGTDDKVEVSLVGESQSSVYVEMKTPLSNRNPFERGSDDRFKLTLPNLGRLKGINIRFGANNWFFTDAWALDKIYVYDPTTITRYATGYVSDTIGNGSTFWMPPETYINFSSAYVIGSIESTMSIGKAPTQDQVTQGWVDHTWAQVISSEDPKNTYFDCAGGNNGLNTTSNIITSKCSLNTTVKMATGYYIDSQHPYQQIYGHNDVNGVQTCGIRASGFRGWDGQCHQIANRLLYTCNPPVTLDDCDESLKPAGYGFSVLMWGKYGVQFDQWCQLNGFPAPPVRASSIFDYIRRYVSGHQNQVKVYHAAVGMQGTLAANMQGIHDQAAHTFFQEAKNYGISNSEMSALTCLPIDKVLEEQQP